MIKCVHYCNITVYNKYRNVTRHRIQTMDNLVGGFHCIYPLFKETAETYLEKKNERAL